MSRQYECIEYVDYDRIPALIDKGRRERAQAMWSMLQKVFGRRDEDDVEAQMLADGHGAPCPTC